MTHRRPGTWRAAARWFGSGALGVLVAAGLVASGFVASGFVASGPGPVAAVAGPAPAASVPGPAPAAGAAHSTPGPTIAAELRRDGWAGRAAPGRQSTTSTGPSTTSTGPSTTSTGPSTAASPCGAAPRAAFADVADTSGAAAAIDCLVLHGIVRGVAHDRFAPDEPLRRDHLASVLASGLETIGVVLPDIEQPRFLDVSGVHADAVERLAAAGIVAGRTATHFAPDEPVRRDQLASLLVRSVAVVAGLEPDGSHDFNDLAGNVHEQAIAAAVTLGMVQGTDASSYAPARTATRAQTAVVVDRLLGVLLDPPPPITALRVPDTPLPATAVRIPDTPPLVRIGGVPDSLRSLMETWTWRPGCPVGPDGLRLVEVVHVDLGGVERWGQLVVHRQVAEDVADAFVALRDQGFAIARMEPVEHFRGDDDASMAANNTSAFNCRRITGGSRFSEHAYGSAIDLNPVQNPYVRGSTVLPTAGRSFRDRSILRPGMLTRPGAVEVFDELGWGWGGDWSSLKDHQHVSLTGR